MNSFCSKVLLPSVFLAAFTLSLFADLVSAAQPNATAKPNILWIGVDQMRSDTPNCNGNPVCQTPNIDRLAREGMNFTRAYTTCCLCSPARASMFTGQYAFRHGMGTNCDFYHSLTAELPHPEDLLHHRLKKLGYRCGFAGKWHVGTELGPVDHGFEGMNLPGYGDIKNYPGFRQYLKDQGLEYKGAKNLVFGNAGEKTLIAGHWDGPTQSTPTHYVASYAIDLMDQFAADKKPFFLTCQFWGPHPPYLPSQEYLGKHDRDAILPWSNFKDDHRNKPASVGRFRSGFYRNLPDDWEGWRELVGLYYDYSTMVDGEIGRLLEHLEKLGLADNTIVIFTSDHGDMIGSHGGLFDKGFMYEEAFRIPLMVRWPAKIQGSVKCDDLVYNMDIMLTILDILGQKDETLDGKSFLTALEGQSQRDRRESIYLEFHGIRFLYSQRALVTTDGYKYIFNPGDIDEFYDLNSDQGELVNLIDSPDHAEMIKKMREQIKRASHQANDPVADYVSKLFGDWETLSGRFEAAGYEPEEKNAN